MYYRLCIGVTEVIPESILNSLKALVLFKGNVKQNLSRDVNYTTQGLSVMHFYNKGYLKNIFAAAVPFSSLSRLRIPWRIEVVHVNALGRETEAQGEKFYGKTRGIKYRETVPLKGEVPRFQAFRPYSPM